MYFSSTEKYSFFKELNFILNRKDHYMKKNNYKHLNEVKNKNYKQNLVSESGNFI